MSKQRRLRGVTWQNPRGYDPLIASARVWETTHPDIRIIWEQLPWYQFEERVLSSLAEGDGTYDLILFDHPWTGKLAAENWLLPWDTLVSATYLANLRKRVVPPSLESYELDGHLWGLPLDAACHASLFRCDYVREDELPATWEDVAAWVQTQHRPPQRYGLVLNVGGVLGHCLFLSLMASLGHPAFHNEEYPTCNRAAAEYVLTLLKDLLRFTPPGSTAWGPWDIYEHFCQYDDVVYSPAIFAYVNYFTGGSAQQHLRLGRLPGLRGHGLTRPILGGVGLGLAATCSMVPQAVEYACFLMSDQCQSTIFPEHSGQPAVKNVWESREINLRFHDFYRTLSMNMAHAYIRPRSPAFHALELSNGYILQRWWDGQQSLRETLDLLHAE